MNQWLMHECAQQQHSSTWPVSYITGSWQEIYACLVCLVSESNNGVWILCVPKCWKPIQIPRLKCKCTLLVTLLVLSAFSKSSTNDLDVLTTSNTKRSSTVLLRSPSILQLLNLGEFQWVVNSEAREQVAGVTALGDHTLCTQTTDDFVASCLAFVTGTQPKVCPHGEGSLRLRYRKCERDAVLVAINITKEQTGLPLPSFEWQDQATDKSETDFQNILYLIYYVLPLDSHQRDTTILRRKDVTLLLKFLY